MIQQTIQIGNSVGVIIPRNVLKEKNIKLGDTVEFDIKSVKPKTTDVDVRFMKMVDEFVEDHKDVLQKLATR